MPAETNYFISHIQRTLFTFCGISDHAHITDLQKFIFPIRYPGNNFTNPQATHKHLAKPQIKKGYKKGFKKGFKR